MAEPLEITSLKEVGNWYSEKNHYSLNKYVTILARIVAMVENSDNKMIFYIKDDSTRHRFKLIVDKSDWSDEFKEWNHYLNEWSIIFAHRVYIPTGKDILIAKYISMYSNSDKPEEKSDRFYKKKPFLSWSPYYISAEFDFDVRRKIRNLRQMNST